MSAPKDAVVPLRSSPLKNSFFYHIFDILVQILTSYIVMAALSRKPAQVQTNICSVTVKNPQLVKLAVADAMKDAIPKFMEDVVE